MFHMNVLFLSEMHINQTLHQSQFILTPFSFLFLFFGCLIEQFVKYYHWAGVLIGVF